MTCTICTHPKRSDIDQALIAGSATLAELAKQYNLSTSALHRHKAHLQAKVNRAQNLIQDNLRQGCHFWLSQVLEILLATIQAARAEGNFKVVLQASSQGTRIISLLMKHELPMDHRFVYEVLSSPQWATQAGLLPHDPNIMVMSRRAMAESLSTPCPEGLAPTSSGLSPEDLDLMQQVLHGLSAPTTPKREKGGKLPGKSHAKKRNNEESQEDALFQKIAGITDFSFLANHAHPGTGSPKLDAILQELATNGIPDDLPLSEFIYEQSLQEGQEKNPPAVL
jgi:hypothetical protein